MTNYKPSNPLGITLRWVARIGSVASIGLLLAFMFGGNEQPPSITDVATSGLLLFPIGIMVGMVMGWWHELLGGIVTVISLVAFYAWHWSSAGNFPTGPYFAIFSLPGLLFLGAWCSQKFSGLSNPRPSTGVDRSKPTA